MHETLVNLRVSVLQEKKRPGEGDHDEEDDGINDARERMSLASNCSFHWSMKALKTDGI